MSAPASEDLAPANGNGDLKGAFVENDREETQLGYGQGGVPFYLAIIWVAYIAAYVIAMTILALPDFRAWVSR